MMRAYVIDEPGRWGLREVPEPRPAPGEVLLEVVAAALNRKDLFLRAGISGPGLRHVPYPLVPGGEVVGVIREVADAVAGWQVGDVVLADPTLSCGTCRWCGRGLTSRCADYGNLGEQRWGGLAELVAVSARGLRRVSSGVDPARAVAAPVAFGTAWHALVTRGGLTAGETVLIVGIGGGVATGGLAIARLAGARALVTSSEDWKLDRALSLGADAGINYAREDVEARVLELTDGRGVDVVLDGAGAASWRSSVRSLDAGGRLCVYGATTGDHPHDFSIRELYQANRSIIGAPMGGRGDLDTVWELVGSGRLEPVVDSVHRLESVEDAFAVLESRRQFGKVVVTPA